MRSPGRFDDFLYVIMTFIWWLNLSYIDRFSVIWVPIVDVVTHEYHTGIIKDRYLQERASKRDGIKRFYKRVWGPEKGQWICEKEDVRFSPRDVDFLRGGRKFFLCHPLAPYSNIILKFDQYPTVSKYHSYCTDNKNYSIKGKILLYESRDITTSRRS